MNPPPPRSRRAERIGWLLFVLSALFFTAAAWRAGDMLALAGALAFLVACFFFLQPLFTRR